MAIVECASCKRNVIPRSDGGCPSCGASTAGATVVPVHHGDPAEASAWRRHEEEKRARMDAARLLQARGNQLTVAGIGLAALGLVISVASFLAVGTDGEGRYFLWTGAVIAGISMLVRGRGLIAEAKKLED
jgi:hypothetical protein